MIFFALLKESISFAAVALAANKLRTFLSLLGITIGIFAIILVFTIVDSLESNIKSSINSLGDNVVYVEKWPWEFGPDYPWWKYMSRPLANEDELERIMKDSDLAANACFQANTSVNVKYESNTVENAGLFAATYDFDKIKSFEITSGRYFTEAESAAGRQVCVVGNAIAVALFKNADAAVGKDIKVDGKKLNIIGVFKKEGESLLDNSLDSKLLTNISCGKKFMDMDSENNGPQIAVKAKPGIGNAELIDELTGIMRGIRRLKPSTENNFALNQTSMFSTSFESLFDMLNITGWIIGGFSILVGGFGIANIMFVSVRERTNLIGIQKSLGAKNIFILLQFLSESVMLSLLGGILGLFFIFVITFFVRNALDFDISLTGANIVLGLTISFLIGIISGFVPAYSASQMDPVEAIRTN